MPFPAGGRPKAWDETKLDELRQLIQVEKLSWRQAAVRMGTTYNTVMGQGRRAIPRIMSTHYPYSSQHAVVCPLPIKPVSKPYFPNAHRDSSGILRGTTLPPLPCLLDL